MLYRHKNKYSVFFICGLLFSPWMTPQSHAETKDWRVRGTAQTYYQKYNGSTQWNNAYNVGAYLSADYLDSANVSLGYNFSKADYTQAANLTENMFYVSGRRHFYPDALPGKLTARLDLYSGTDTLSYPSGVTPPTVRGRHKTMSITSGGTIKEKTNIFVYYPQLSFINYAKTFYADIGYAHSKYGSDSTINVDQLTPTVGVGWDDSYNWLQLRGYFIKVNGAATTYNADRFSSLEAVYTHWYSGSAGHEIEFIRFSILAGNRVLAVDPDAAVVYSTADKETGAYSVSMQWKLSQATKLLLLGKYTQYKDDAINDKYNGVLFYLNLQQQL